MQGLMAAALYEPLSGCEQAELEAYLARHPALQREFKELQGLKQSIPVSHTEFTGDLLPALRGQIQQASAHRFVWGRWLLSAGLGAAVLALCLMPFFRVSAPSGTEPMTVKVAPMAQAMELARVLAPQDFPKAIAHLESALKSYPEAPEAFDAQVLIADLEYNQGERYAQAHEAYDRARRRFPEQWGRDPQPVLRFNLLEESKAADYEPLYQLNVAMNKSERAAAHLEQVMARYPGTLVALRAADAMLDTIRRDEPELSMASALEQARECVSEPAARAQLTMALGDVCWKEMGDANCAREAYRSVQENGPAVLAQLAEENLLELAVVQ